MDKLAKQYQEAVDLDDIPGAILVAHDITGKFHYAKTFGQRTLLDGSKKSHQVDDLVNTYSSTKLLTTMAVLQCVEKGFFTLDEDVSRILPELGTVQVLIGFDADEKPQYEDKKRPITLSKLLTHSAGFAYDASNPQLRKWRAQRGELPMSGPTVETRAGLPLIFQPGTNWAYGVGVDWAGKMVERATGILLEEYFEKHIFQPLDITNASFWPWTNDTMRAKMIDLNPDDPKGLGKAGVSGHDIGNDHTDCFGGGGLYMSPSAFAKVLYTLLANDGRVLKPATVDMMFAPQLSAEAHVHFNKLLTDPTRNGFLGQGLPAGTKRDYGYGGMLIQEAQPGWYAEGTMTWAGGNTLAWFLDRKTGLCGVAAPQMHLREVPAQRKPGEEPRPVRKGGMIYEDLTAHLKQVFRTGIYGVYDEWKKSQ